MILTVEEYKEMNFLESTDDESLKGLLQRAESVLRAVINQDVGSGENISPPALEELKRAIAFQAEYYIIHDFYEDDFKTIKLGDLSYTLTGNRMISRMALICLKRAGLFYSACEVRE